MLKIEKIKDTNNLFDGKDKILDGKLTNMPKQDTKTGPPISKICIFGLKCNFL